MDYTLPLMWRQFVADSQQGFVLETGVDIGIEFAVVASRVKVRTQLGDLIMRRISAEMELVL